VVFEGDALLLVQSMHNEQQWGRYAQLFEDIRTILQGFLVYAVQFVCKDANKVVHALAKLAVLLILCGLMNECPSSIHHLVLADQGFST
jgi:hypothetical protein